MMTSGRNSRTFTADATAVAFPLGGIGTGNVSLGARGELRDWEIFNHAGKGTLFPNTFFAIRAQVLRASRPYEGAGRTGPSLLTLYPMVTIHRPPPGLPRFRSTTFRGEYPFATIDFEDPDLPVAVRLEAWTPLIPLEPEDLGAAMRILTYTVTNTSDEPVALTIVGSLINPVGGLALDRFGIWPPGAPGRTSTRLRDEAGLRGLFLHHGNMRRAHSSLAI